jgi:transcriptional regulator with XRE-family HTH domain
VKDQILKIIEAEGLTPARFADEIGVQRSSISHIISGRNKPSYDFIAKILKRFKGINAEWLITGNGMMIKSTEAPLSIQPDLFGISGKTSDFKPETDSTVTFEHKHTDQSDESSRGNQYSTEEQSLRSKGINRIKGFTNVNEIDFVLVFYVDGTFSRYSSRS